MAHPPQQQTPNTKAPQADEQEQLQYPGNEGKRPPLIQPDAQALLQEFPSRDNQNSANEALLQKLGDENTGDREAEEFPNSAGDEPPIGDRKDIR